MKCSWLTYTDEERKPTQSDCPHQKKKVNLAICQLCLLNLCLIKLEQIANKQGSA